MLASRSLSGLAVIAAIMAVAVECLRAGGLDGLILNLPALAVVWAAAYGLIGRVRDWRGVRPQPDTSARRPVTAAKWLRSQG